MQKKKKKPKRDILVTHYSHELKKMEVYPHKDDTNLRGDLKKDKKGKGLWLEFKLED